jgi:hypothetical protein
MAMASIEQTPIVEINRNPAKNLNQRQRSRKIDSEDKLVQYIRTQLGDPLITVDVTDTQILNLIDDTFSKFSDWIYNGQQNQVFVINTLPGIQDYILDDRVQAISGVSFADGLEGGNSTGNSGMNGSMGGVPFGDLMPPQYVPYVNAQGQMSSLASNGAFGCFNSYSATGVAGGVSGIHTGDTGDADSIESAYASMVNVQTLANMFSTNISYDFNSQNHILRIFDDQTGGAIAIEASLYYIPNPDYDSAYGHSWIKEYSLNLVKRQWGNNLGKYDSSLVGGASVNYQRLIDEGQAELDRLNEDLLEKWSEPLGIFSA